MKNFLFILFLSLSGFINGQNRLPEVFGFRHFQTIYKGDTVDFLIKSKKGDELKRKPLLLFCQGSLPIPLIIKYDENGKQGIYHVFVLIQTVYLLNITWQLSGNLIFHLLLTKNH